MSRIRRYLTAIERGKVEEYHDSRDYEEGKITRDEYYKRRYGRTV